MPDGDVSLLFRMMGDSSDAKKAFGEVDDSTEGTGKKFKALAGVAAGAGVAAAASLASGFAQNLDIESANAKLAGQLGLSKEAADVAGTAAGQVYADNFGGSIQEVDGAIRAIGVNLANVSTTGAEDLKKMTEQALILSDAFDLDVNESTRAAGALMKNGLAKDATEAFDIITSGEQMGVDKAGDLLDTLTEYSPQFSKLGINGKQMLTIFSEGLRAGARDTDTIADAFKEFSLRSIDGSKLTSGALKDIGLNAKTTAADVAAGGDRANHATFAVLQALEKIKDPVKQNAAGVALFGTQWEDTLRKILPAVAGAEEGMEGVNGSTQKLSDTVGNTASGRIETLKRGFEQWQQQMASSDGALGTVVTGIGAFGGVALGAGSSAVQLVAGLAALNTGMIATKAATLAGTVATGIATAAQWLWNVALTANPIGLIILAIAALVAGLIWFFTQTELGRTIFAGAMQGITTAFGWVWEKAQQLWGWVKGNWPLLLGILTGPIGLAVAFITTHWDSVVTFVRGLPGKIASAARGLWDGLWNPFRDTLNKIIGGWNRLHFSIPGWSWAGLNIPGVNIGVPNIAYLASGGIVTGPTLAMLGEGRGPEAVIPLDQAGDFGMGGMHVTVNVTSPLGTPQQVASAVSDALQRMGSRGIRLSVASG